MAAPNSPPPTSARPSLFALLDATAEFGAWLRENDGNEKLAAVSLGGDAAASSHQDDPQRTEPTYGQV